jgi:hypothetical protein
MEMLRKILGRVLKNMIRKVRWKLQTLEITDFREGSNFNKATLAEKVSGLRFLS